MTNTQLTLKDAERDYPVAWRNIHSRIGQLSREYGGELIAICAVIHHEGTKHELRLLAVDPDELNALRNGERTEAPFGIWVPSKSGFH
jgi:hypothetical protein